MLRHYCSFNHLIKVALTNHRPGLRIKLQGKKLTHNVLGSPEDCLQILHDPRILKKEPKINTDRIRSCICTILLQYFHTLNDKAAKENSQRIEDYYSLV